MSTSRFRRTQKKIKIKGTSLSSLDVLDYSKGFSTYLANDALPLDTLRTAQDARISTLGRIVTRRGSSFYSDAAGETIDDAQTFTGGASDQDVTSTTWRAEPFTPTTSGRLTKATLRLESDTATAPLIVKIYDDSSGAPGSLLATSSIPASEISGTYSYPVARFVEAPVVASASTYWVVAHVQEEGAGSHHWASTTNTTDGLVSTDSGSSWSAASVSMNFQTYISTDGASKGLFRAYKSDGTKETLLAHGTSVSKISDVDGSLTSIDTGLASGATKYRWANINDEVFIVNGVDAPRKYDFSSTAAMGGSPPIASLIAAHQDLIWLNDVSDPTRLEFSNEDSYEASDSTNFLYVPSPKSPEPITALVSLNGTLTVFTTGSKWSLYGDQKATFELVESPAKKGTFTQESVAVTRNHMYFMSDDGIYRSNGIEDELISTPITDIIEGMTNKDSAVLAIDKNRLKIFYRASGSGVNNKCLVYNLDYGSWESQDTNQYISHAIMFKGGSDDFEFIVASDLVGQVFKQGESSNNYSDLGAPLTFELRTGYIHGGTPNAKKIIKRWYPRFAKQSRSYNVQCQYDDNFAGSPTSFNVATGATGATWGGGATWGDGSVYGSTTFGSDRVHLPGQTFYRQLRIRKYGVDTPVEFLGHSLRLSEKRVR